MNHRTRAHLQPARGWTNDPIGPIHWRGRYHLFHQANPDGGYWHRPHWGHFVSDDLVTWQELPVAFSPRPDGPDAAGCYSGSVVTDGARALAFYTGATGAQGPQQRQVTCLATSTDDDLVAWQQHPAPVTEPPPGFDLLGFRDPFVWRHDGRWLQFVGSGIAGVGGALFLYESDDLDHWRYVGPAFVGDRDTDHPLWTGDMWECPALLHLDGTDVVILSLHDEATTHYPVALEGRFDGTRFVPERGARMDLGPDFYAPCVLRDPTGRHVCWGWAWEARSDTAQRAAGWAGVLTLPRLLTRRPDGIGVEPLPELTALRGEQRQVTPRPTADGWRAAGAEGLHLEITARFPPTPRPVGLRLRCSPDRAEQTVVRYDRTDGRLLVDRRQASLDPEALGGEHGGPLVLADDEPLDLRVYVDASIVEVYANGRAAITARIYPTRDDALGLEVIAGGLDPHEVEVAAWELRAVLHTGGGDDPRSG